MGLDPATGVDPENEFHISLQGTGVIIGRPPANVLSREQTLVLAAWLVLHAHAIEDEGAPDFGDVIEIVEAYAFDLLRRAGE